MLEFPFITTWQTEEENSCLHNTCLLATKGLNTVIADPWTPGLMKHPWQDLLWWNTNEECLPACWELLEAKEPPSNKMQWEVRVDLWHTLYKLGQNAMNITIYYPPCVLLLCTASHDCSVCCVPKIPIHMHTYKPTIYQSHCQQQISHSPSSCPTGYISLSRHKYPTPLPSL